MLYKDMIAQVSEISGVDEQKVRDVLFALPDVLINLDTKEQVRTPLGVFTMHHRKARQLNLPGSEKTATIEEEYSIKLKAGSRMRRKP